MVPAKKRFYPLATFILLAVATQAGCWILLWLSGFGQDPFDVLPIPMIMAFGALFTGPLESLARNWRRSLLWSGVAAAALVNGALAASLTPFGQASPDYLLAPLTALVLTSVFRSLPGDLGEMLSAMTVYLVATVLANYTFDSFIPLGGFFLVNVGTLFFGITFTQRDRVHRFGRRMVYAMILAAAVANVAAALSLGTPLRYVAVAFLAIVISEAVDTEIYARLLHRPWLVRVASSNAFSAPLDSAIFTVLAFAGESFATAAWLVQVIVTDVLVKYLSGLVAALRLLRPSSGGRPAVTGRS